MRNFLAFIGLVAILAGASAAVFFFGGYYSVAATAQEPEIVRWALVNVRTASVHRHATNASPGGLDSAAKVHAGARAFSERGCINCHGGPGVDWAKFSEGLRPDPADLKEIVKDRTASELFWVVKNGINMTGMPSFGAAPDDELWSIVAFLQKQPTVSDEDFKSWTASSSPKP